MGDTDRAIEARVSRNYLWHFASAAFMVLLYYLHPDDPDRIVWLFAATFGVIHGAAEKVINYMKADREMRK